MGNDYEIWVSEEDSKSLIKNVVKFHKKTMNRKIRGAKKGSKPIIKDHTLLNFKGVQKITFPKDGIYPFEFGDINFLLNGTDGMNAIEGYFFANYEWDFLSYVYSLRFNKRPGVYRISQTRYDRSFITDFFSHFSPPSKSYVASEQFNDNGLELNEFTIALEKGLYLNYDNEDLSIYYDKETHLFSEDNAFTYFIKLLAGYKKQSHEKNKIHVVYKGDYGFDKSSFDVKKIDININDNYNDDFSEVSEEIIVNLNDKKKTGLYILNGDPGTGKTSFIRYLSGKVNRNIIFVSPDMVDYITDPAFIPFLMSNSDSILIIEDAEPALQKRITNGGVGRSGAISNILNLTDGLLSDCLNISIVATFNTSTKVIDEALLRKGRLVKSYTFKNLASHKAQKLLKKLGHDVEIKNDMSLADIYFYGEDNKGENFGNNKKVGY